MRQWVTHKNHNSALDILELFPFDHAIWCQLYNLITIRRISTKVHTVVNHIQTTCHPLEPYFLHVYFSPLPLFVGLCVTKSCPLYNLITVIDISTKLDTFVKHIQTVCHA